MDVDTDYPHPYLQQRIVVKWSRSWTVDTGIKETISNNFCNTWATQMILFIWSQPGAVCPIMKITCTKMWKPCSRMNFIIINLTEPKSYKMWKPCSRVNFISVNLTEPKWKDLNKWSFNENILNALLRILISILIKQVLCIYGETSHQEWYKCTE